jgi:inorganic pyrophosphatase/exopolyphosphatase
MGPSQAHKLRIVMGNTSCDVDSAIGALALAYYYFKKSEDKELWLPVINSNKKDFFCNLEII